MDDIIIFHLITGHKNSVKGSTAVLLQETDSGMVLWTCSALCIVRTRDGSVMIVLEGGDYPMHFFFQSVR